MLQTPTLRRLMRESRELSPSPPAPILPNPTFHAGPLSTNLHEWHFTLLGPPGTAYAGGMYHGRIVLPTQYPLRPPSFRFLTPSGRFEVNREICLSISGFHEESWQPAWGVRLALTALRAFMTESGKGQIGGLEASDKVRKELAERSRSWSCNGCETGAKPNEEVMKEWWECCRAKGVEVGEDGEVVEGTGREVEAIPEELRLGYRDELGKTNAAGEGGSSEPHAQDKHISSQTDEDTPQQDCQAENKRTPLSLESDGPGASALPVRLSEPPVASSDEASRSPPNDPSSQSGHREGMTTGNINTTPSSSSDTTRRLQQQLRQQTAALQIQQSDRVSTPYLDKAISGVIVALLLMVLKKIFYV